MVSGTDPTLGPDDLPKDPLASYRPPSRVPGEGRAFEPTALLGSPANELPHEPKSSDVRGGPDRENTEQAPKAYVLRREVGEGTFGEVWEAVQVTLKRVVAVKRPKPHAAEADTEESKQVELEFVKEALTAGQLDHPNVVPVYDLGCDEQGRPLLAMKLVEGDRWDELIASEERNGHEFYLRHVSILIKMSKAVAFAHSRGIVHRDLKPHQVMVGRFGEVFLMDWGLAVGLPDRQTDQEKGAVSFVTPVAEASNPAGTAAFMAPEQTEATPDRIGAWTDIYLLGGTLYYILTGQAPHAARSSWEAFQHAARGHVEAPETAAPVFRIPGELSEICLKALAADPKLRPASVQQLIQSLEGWLSGTAARSESREITVKAGELLHVGSHSSYEVLEEADVLLARALLLWPENPEACELHRRLLEEYTEQALAQGDLTLAAAQAERLTDAGIRSRLLEKVTSAMSKAEAQARQLRLAAYGAFTMLLAVAFLALLLARRSAEAMVAESRRQADTRVLEMARRMDEQRRRHEEHNASLFSRMSELQRTVAELIDLAGREALTPSSLEQKEDWSAVWLTSRPGAVDHLHAKLAGLDQLRANLLAQGEWVEPDPPEISFARGVLALAEGSEAQTREAYHHFTRAAELQPTRHEPHVALGVAAARLDAMSSATSHLHQAVQRVGFGHSLQNNTISTMLREANYRRWQSAQPVEDDLIIEAASEGRNSHLYRELSGSWINSAHTANYKSAASGLSSAIKVGSRRLLFYEPFRAVNAKVPARSRFTPSFPVSRTCHVYVTWPGEANAAPVYYTVSHAAGTTVFPVAQDGYATRQLSNGNCWVSLGEYEFLPGDQSFIEINVGDDLRPLAPERYGQVSVDAVLFAAKPLSSGTCPPDVDQTANSAEPMICDVVEGDESSGINWYTSLEDAAATASKSGKPILYYCFHPIDSYFIHDLSRNRDYCENRLLVHPAVKALVNEHFVPVSVDLSRALETAKRRGIPLAKTSLSIDSTPDTNMVDLILAGDEVLISPADLIIKLQQACRISQTVPVRASGEPRN